MEFMSQFRGWTNFEKIWAIIFTGLLLYTSFMWGDDIVGITASMSGMLCVILVAKGNRWNYFWGVINALTYSYVAYKAGYSGDLLLNMLCFLPMQFIGLYMWNKNYHNTSDVVAVKSFTIINWITTVAMVSIGTVIIGLLMPTINEFLGMDPNPQPFIDAFTTFASIYAMVLMVQRYTEQYALWFLVNIFSVIMWIIMDDMTMVVMFSAYFINGVYGWYNWRKLEVLENENKLI